MFSCYDCSKINIWLILNELIYLLPRFAVLSLLKVKKKKGKKKPPMRDAPRAIFQDLRGPAMESLGTGARRG